MLPILASVAAQSHAGQPQQVEGCTTTLSSEALPHVAESCVNDDIMLKLGLRV